MVSWTSKVDAPSSPLWVVLVTAPKDRAVGLARALVDERLAACVNLIPGIRSIYRWEGQREEADEVLLVIKTTAAGYGPLEQGVRRLHPYTVPEVVGLPAAAALPAYAAWVADSVGGQP